MTIEEILKEIKDIEPIDYENDIEFITDYILGILEEQLIMKKERNIKWMRLQSKN